MLGKPPPPRVEQLARSSHFSAVKTQGQAERLRRGAIYNRSPPLKNFLPYSDFFGVTLAACALFCVARAPYLYAFKHAVTASEIVLAGRNVASDIVVDFVHIHAPCIISLRRPRDFIRRSFNRFYGEPFVPRTVRSSNRAFLKPCVPRTVCYKNLSHVLRSRPNGSNKNNAILPLPPCGSTEAYALNTRKPLDKSVGLQ